MHPAVLAAAIGRPPNFGPAGAMMRPQMGAAQLGAAQQQIGSAQQQMGAQQMSMLMSSRMLMGGCGRPGMAQPGMAQPGMAQPGMAQPGMAQPGMGARPQLLGAEQMMSGRPLMGAPQQAGARMGMVAGGVSAPPRMPMQPAGTMVPQQAMVGSQLVGGAGMRPMAMGNLPGRPPLRTWC